MATLPMLVFTLVFVLLHRTCTGLILSSEENLKQNDIKIFIILVCAYELSFFIKLYSYCSLSPYICSFICIFCNTAALSLPVVLFSNKDTSHRSPILCINCKFLNKSCRNFFSCTEDIRLLKIMTYRFIPSLEHMACVQVALPLYYDEEIQDILEGEGQMTIQDYSFDSDSHERWQSIETLAAGKLSLPQLLSNMASTFLRPIHLEIKKWMLDHEDLGNLCDIYCYVNFEKILFWKHDGTVDRTRTATKFVRNENFDLVTRFEMACTYFFEDDVLALWRKLDESLTSFSRFGTNEAVRFWVRYLREESGENTSWKEMVDEHFRHFNYRQRDTRIRVSCFFPYLLWERKRRFLSRLRWGMSHSDDFQSCLQAVDESESEQLIKLCPVRYLFCCLQFPYQSLFMVEAAKLWDHMNANMFHGVLERILRFCILRGFEDFDYLKLFKDFWERSPDSFKEDIRSREEIFDAVQVALNYNADDASLSLQEILEEQMPLYWNALVL